MWKYGYQVSSPTQSLPVALGRFHMSNVSTVLYIDFMIINILRLRKNGRHFTDAIFKCIFLNENVWVHIGFSLKFVPNGPINNIPALVQIMAWRCPGDKPLSDPLMVSLPMHVCITWPQGVSILLMMTISVAPTFALYVLWMVTISMTPTFSVSVMWLATISVAPTVVLSDLWPFQWAPVHKPQNANYARKKRYFHYQYKCPFEAVRHMVTSSLPLTECML